MSISVAINSGNSPELSIDPFRVYIRIRPLSEKEKLMNEKLNSGGKNNLKHIHNPSVKNILVVEENLLFVLDPDSLDYNGKKEKSFVFDNVFTDKHSNFDIFSNVIRGMIDNVLRGYNSTALAYGVTGTGKTHTIFGDMSELYGFSEESYSNPYSEKGVCLLALDYLFQQITENEQERSFSVKISYLEIYNEQVIDLLVSKPTSLMIVEDSVKGVVVPDLTEYNVSNSKDLVKLLIEGNSRRTMASTTQNQFSSRSHAILQVVVEQRSKTRDTREEMLISKFLVVDLAGSERGGLEKGLRTQEGANINKSLLSLGNCINILSDKSKKGSFVPYRDSKLTRLLKDSLGGNISTVMIACVTPSPLSYDETVNTLKYATRARTIQKKITKNIREVDVHISQYKDIIDSLKGEIDQLKEIIRNQQSLINEKMFQVQVREGEGDNNDLIKEEKETTNRNQHMISSSQSTPKLQIVKNLPGSDMVKLESSTNVHPSNMNLEHIDKREKNKSNSNIFIPPSNISDPLCKSTLITNKNGNYSNISMISRKSAATQGYAQKNSARTAQNVNLEVYQKFLVNAMSLNVENILQVEEGNNNVEDLEKHIDNLQNDKILLEEFMEKSKILDKTVNEKYKMIKSFYQAYLELINDKLIENIEQNMILKFNMKEILDLNNTNNQNLSILYSQIILLEKNKLNSNLDESEVDEQIQSLKEEMKNIQSATEENERIKERIAESLKRNMKIKKMLKKILVKLISNTTSNKDNSQKEKFEQAYQSVVKEKQELEMKNNKFKKYLGEVMKEKEKKDEKLMAVERELEKLRRQLEEKDKKIRQIENDKNQIRTTNTNTRPVEDNIDNFDNVVMTNNNYEGENVLNTVQSEVENMELNLQDDYFGGNSRKKFINDINKETGYAKIQKRNTGSALTTHENKDQQNTNSSFSNIQSIKYIINQTNNIVNNNINKIINKEKEAEGVKNPQTTNKSINMNEDGKKPRVMTKSISSKRTIISNSNNATPNNKQVKKLGSINTSSGEHRGRSQSKSPRSMKKNKMREFDKIIESQLNEVYNKKAKELGDKMKKKMSGKSNSNNLINVNKRDSNNIGMNVIDNEKQFNMILDKFNRMIEFNPPISNNNNVSIQNQNRTSNDNNQQLNRSLSISCVSVNQEGDFNSELDIALGIPANNLGQFSRKETKLTFTPKGEEGNGNNINSSNNTNNTNNKYTNAHVRKMNNMNTLSSNPQTSSEEKQMNIQKFINNNPSSNMFLNNITKDRPVAINNTGNPASMRDHSPTVSNLRQARLEKQLKNQTMETVNPVLTSNNQSQSNSQIISNTSQNVNKFISKNTIDFLNEYLNTKKGEVSDKADEIPQSSRTVLEKNEVLEAAMSSLINANVAESGNNDALTAENNQIRIETENDSGRDSIKPTEENDKTLVREPLTEDRLPNAEELFKSLNDVIKNQKLNKFLDKK